MQFLLSQRQWNLEFISLLRHVWPLSVASPSRTSLSVLTSPALELQRFPASPGRTSPRQAGNSGLSFTGLSSPWLPRGKAQLITGGWSNIDFLWKKLCFQTLFTVLKRDDMPVGKLTFDKNVQLRASHTSISGSGGDPVSSTRMWVLGGRGSVSLGTVAPPCAQKGF